MKRRKLDNKGFSLVEVIVAIVIVALVATPILGSFATSSRVNAKAKILQDATDVAQYAAELIKAQSVADLGGVTIDTDAVGVWSGIIGDKEDEYKNRYFEGASGERFYVTFELNSEKYSAVSGATTNTVNDSKIPEIANLYTGGNIVAFEEFRKMDTQMKNRGYTSKVTDLNITVMNMPMQAGVFSYDIKLVMTYSKASGSETKTISLGEYVVKTDLNEELAGIYLIYPSYCRNGGATGESTDVININYTQNAAYSYMGANDVDVNVFFVWQEVADEDYPGISGHYMQLNPGNINVSNPTDPNITGEVVLHSNVPTTVSSKSLTEGEKNNISIYELTITVRKDSPTGDIITTFTTTKEE